jgi:hypothetical protein
MYAEETRMDEFSPKVRALRLKPDMGRLVPTEDMIADFERRFSVHLPADYRRFLFAHGGQWQSLTAPCLEEFTPFGTSVCVQDLYGFMTGERQVFDIRWATEAFGGAPSFVAIASGAMNGNMIVLACWGQDAGSVYHFDAQQRALWPDEEFRYMFSALHPLIEEWLEKRRTGQLPKKAEGYESLYLLGHSFTEFFEAIQTSDEDEDE